MGEERRRQPEVADAGGLECGNPSRSPAGRWQVRHPAGPRTEAARSLPGRRGAARRTLAPVRGVREVGLDAVAVRPVAQGSEFGWVAGRGPPASRPGSPARGGPAASTGTHTMSIGKAVAVRRRCSARVAIEAQKRGPRRWPAVGEATAARGSGCSAVQARWAASAVPGIWWRMPSRAPPWHLKQSRFGVPAAFRRSAARRSARRTSSEARQQEQGGGQGQMNDQQFEKDVSSSRGGGPHWYSSEKDPKMDGEMMWSASRAQRTFGFAFAAGLTLRIRHRPLQESKRLQDQHTNRDIHEVRAQAHTLHACRHRCPVEVELASWRSCMAACPAVVRQKIVAILFQQPRPVRLLHRLRV